MATIDLTSIEERLDGLESRVEQIRMLLLLIAGKQGVVPFAIGQTVYPRDDRRLWSLREEIVADYSDDLTHFKSKYGNFFRVDDFAAIPSEARPTQDGN